MTTGMVSAIVGPLRRASLPLAAYYAVTLALPLANGAAGAGAPFVEHALVVLVVPPVLVALWWAGQAWGQVVNRHIFHALAPHRPPCRGSGCAPVDCSRSGVSGVGSGRELSLFSRSGTSRTGPPGPWQRCRHRSTDESTLRRDPGT